MKAALASWLAGTTTPMGAGVATRAALRAPAAQAPAAASEAARPAPPHGTRLAARVASLASRAAGVVSDPYIAHLTGRARRIGLVQKRAEIRRLAAVVRRLRPARVLEIGTAHGGSFLVWTRLATADALLISIDLPPWERDDPNEVVKTGALRRFAGARQRVHLFRSSSHEPAVRRAAAALLGGLPLDFLFIDGDHSYDGVKQDFDDYAPWVRPGGVVALHDIHPHSRGWGGDVPRFWRELRAGRTGVELIADPGQDGFGIGVIWM
jgi:predicted O-methyltransferase YrrM